MTAALDADGQPLANPEYRPEISDGGAPQKRRLTGAEVHKARDLKTEDVYVSEWNGFVMMKALSAKERDAFEQSFIVTTGKKRDFKNVNMRARLVVLCAIDEKQNRLFSDQDASWLGDKNASAVNKLYEAASRLSGITEADAEELEGNSTGAPGDGSV